MSARRPGRKRLIAEMNLVPLIDVSLILVIIFMVLTPMMVQSELSVKLPKASSGSPVPAATTVHVEIARNGTLLIEGRPVSWNDLTRELSLRLGRARSKTVLVQADKSVAVERVVAVLDAAKRLGVGKMGVGVEARP
ncbi:MAG: biopolymer transporter ExbD [Elusimicrobia bacterium]|nr:biopolymer transporter ExbD [Elusimicrobiota bacterium]MDE2314715.1 biopolymer transporter ExbD [Elusimicrobiota bacterium]